MLENLLESEGRRKLVPEAQQAGNRVSLDLSVLLEAHGLSEDIPTCDSCLLSQWTLPSRHIRAPLNQVSTQAEVLAGGHIK